MSGRWWLLLGICACGPAVRPTYSATFTDRAIRIESYARSFHTAEPALVESLQGDPRLLARIRPEIATELVDPFMFSDRQSALERSRDAFERVALPADAALRAEVLGAHAEGQTVPEEPLLLQVKLEQEAFRRLLDMEDARIERERTLPTGAADLVRAIDEGWPTSPRPGATHDLESMLAWRFSNVDESLLPDTLSQAQRDDLEGELAAIAPRVASLPKAASAMVKLRASLEAMWASPYALEDEHTMDMSLSLYVGSSLSFDALDEAFDSAASAFEGQSSAGLSVLDPKVADTARARAKRMLLAAPPCAPRVPVRSSLDMAPPPERAWACSLLHAFDDARTDEEELSADLAWHDAVVVARWAVATHGPVRSVDAALRRAHLMLPLSDAEASRLMLRARAQPMNAIAAGVAASILVKQGVVRARTRAHRWRGIGDAPMDLIEPMLR